MSAGEFIVCEEWEGEGIREMPLFPNQLYIRRTKQTRQVSALGEVSPSVKLSRGRAGGVHWKLLIAFSDFHNLQPVVAVHHLPQDR